MFTFVHLCVYFYLYYYIYGYFWKVLTIKYEELEHPSFPKKKAWNNANNIKLIILEFQGNPNPTIFPLYIVWLLIVLLFLTASQSKSIRWTVEYWLENVICKIHNIITILQYYPEPEDCDWVLLFVTKSLCAIYNSILWNKEH